MKKIIKISILLVILLIVNIYLIINRNDNSIDIENVLCKINIYYNDSLVSEGNGFLYKNVKDGTLVITNEHVINEQVLNDLDIKVINNNKEYKGTLINKDKYLDLAIIKIDEILKVKQLENTKYNIGDTIYNNYIDSNKKIVKNESIIKDNKITKVTVDSVDDYKYEVIELDLELPKGSSGSPITNKDGKVIGIVLGMDIKSKRVYSIPLKTIRDNIKLLEDNKIERYDIGAQITDINNSELDLDSLGVTHDLDKGVVVVKVKGKGPIFNSGIRTMDVITKIEGIEINDISDFKYELYKDVNKYNFNITFYRGNEYIDTKLVLK